MSHNKLFEILGDDSKSKAFITNLASGYVQIPYIVEETLKVLDDDSPMFSIISDTNKKALCSMLQQYFDDCWELYIEDLKLDSILNYGKIEVYKVEAANGLRYATVKEIDQGIKGLIGEFVYPAGEEQYKLLCLLQWSFTGVSYYFRQAGYQLDYDKDGKVMNTFFELVQKSAYQLKELFDWVSVSDNIEKTLKIIKKMKKNKGYKYATYEKDEITEDITIKQLVYNIYKVFPRNSDNNNYRKALAIALSAYKKNKKLSPLEVSTLREIYDEHALDLNRSRQRYNAENDKIKAKCEILLKERYSGKLDSNHFAYKIIDTLRRTNYSKCSDKQLNIINDAYKLLEKSMDNVIDNNEVTEVISDAEIDLSLETLSDAIGVGLFEDEDEE